MHLLRGHGRLLLRIEALEQRLAGAGLGDLLEASTEPGEGLASGTLAPPMTAEDVVGRPVSWTDLLQSGPALLLFTSPRCGACQDLRHEIKAWRQRLAGQLRLVLVSDGTAEEIRREAADFGLADMLVDRDLRLFRAFEAEGTPSAVLVQDNGTIGSSLASGQPAIMALLARQVAHDEDASAEANEIVAAPGALLPALPLRRLAGGSSTVGDLVREPTVILFWNPGCGYCRSMRDDLRRWERRQLPRAPRLVIISSGSEASTQAEGFEAEVFLDSDFALGRTVGIGGTPMALLVDAEARIAFAPVAGRDAVLALAAAGSPASGVRRIRTSKS